MTIAWGSINDPDTLSGIADYEHSGLTLWLPEMVESLGSFELRRFARQCSDIIDGTYNGNYPQSMKNAELLAESIASGDTLMFALLNDTRILATASLVRRSNAMSGQLKFVELSKAAKHTLYAKHVQVRFLSKYRLVWAAKNLFDTDFLYGSPRVAREGIGGVQGGKQAQSVWWGGRRHGMPLPLIATNAGWNFRIGGIEPLSGFMMPLNATKWIEAVQEHTIYVPDESVADQLRSLIVEGTDGRVRPIVVTEPDSAVHEPHFREARKPMADVVSKFYVTEIADHLPRRSVETVNNELQKTISQKVIVESDIASTPRGGRMMRWLLAHGWTFTGWQPSEVHYGGICPMFARVNHCLVHELIEPMHYPQYFDDGGLRSTRKVLDNMYVDMRSKALAA